jgi:peptidase E
METQIVAMGGGGFAMEPENLLLDNYVLSLARNRRKPRVCFIPTASGDSDNYIERFYTSFGKLNAIPSAKGALPSGYAADDGVGLYFVGTRLAQIVSSRLGARAYDVRVSGSEIKETALVPKYLGQ